MAIPTIVRFISQKCLRYDPQTNLSLWRMKALFSDGSVWEWEEWK